MKKAATVLGWRDQLLGLGIALLYVVWLLSTVRNLGFARDEGFYFHAAMDYARWFQMLFDHPSQAMERGSIDSIWGTNHEHPALMKSLFALSWMYLHEKHHVFTDASTAFRFPAIVMSGIAVWVTYLFGARAYSRRAGIVGAVLLGLMPNVFYHSHLACFDMAITAMWVACIYVYWRSQQEGGIRWAIAAGVMYGLTLETKHNAWILPAVFLTHAVFTQSRGAARHLKSGRLPIPASILAMATLGPLVFYLLWPWIWNDTIPRLQEYVNFHVHHEYYNIEYLGRNYYGPPSPKSYAPVMILATVPTVTIALFALGALDRIRNGAKRFYAYVAPSLRRDASHLRFETDRAQTDLLFALAFILPLAPFFLEKTPIFGGTKHWMPAYPFLAILAGRGFDLVALAMQSAFPKLKDKAQTYAVTALGASVILGPLAVTAHSHPFGLSAYVPFVGGTAGGADLGLSRQFWGFTTQSVAPYFEKSAPGSTVFIHDTAWDSWGTMLAEKRIRSDLRGVGSPSEAQIALIHHELHMGEVEFMTWVAFGHIAPDWVLTHDGVPIVIVYKR